MRLPITTPATGASRNLARYIGNHQSYLMQRAFLFGAVLFRGWDIPTAHEFERSVNAFELVDYDMSGSAAPRTTVTRTVSTANDAPPDAVIPFHHEMGQAKYPPSYIFFYCDISPTVGGVTPIVDSRQVSAYVAHKYPTAHVKLRKGLRYRRVMPEYDDPTSPIGRSWRSTFNVDTRDELDSCTTTMDMTWNGTDLETITSTIPGIRKNERTGIDVFVNSMIAARTGWMDERNTLEKAVVYDDLSPIDYDMTKNIECFMRRNCIEFEWQKGDILMIDNSVTMHARNPYNGSRRILASIRNYPDTYIARDECVCLPSWDQMPTTGFGCWKLADPVKSVYEAIRVGYRHIDTAADYGNEKEVGTAIANSIGDGIITRDELWVTSKLWNTYHNKVEYACRRTLYDLQLDVLDLYLIHFPITLKHTEAATYPPGWEYDEFGMQTDHVPLQETWRQMEDLVRKGLVKNIGVSNFPCSLIMDLLSYANIPPAVIQVELHPQNAQGRLVEYCQRRGIHVSASSPFGPESYTDNTMLTNTIIERIADDHKTAPSTVLLSWAHMRNTSVIVRSENTKHMTQNLKRVELTNPEMQKLAELNTGLRYNDPGVFTRHFGGFEPIFD